MRTVHKVMKILEDLGESGPAGVTELANRIGADKSVVHRILRTLRDGDWVQQDSRTRTYRIGPALSDLLSHMPSRTDLIVAAAPVLDALVKEVDETCYFSVRQGAFNVVELIRESSKEMRVVSEVGRRIPLHQGSAGNVLLAFERPSTREVLIEKELPLLAENEAIDMDHLKKELPLIRERGWSYDRGDYFPGVCGLAAPIMSSHGVLLGCLCIRAPASRLPFEVAEEWAPHLVIATSEVVNAVEA